MLARLSGNCNLYALVGGNVNVNSVAAMDNSKQFLKKLKIDLSHDPGVLLMGMYSKELKGT